MFKMVMEFKLYLYGIEMIYIEDNNANDGVQIVPLWN